MVFILGYCFGQQFKLQGTVTNEIKEPLADIAISIKERDQLVFTNGNGVFTFDSLLEGKYTLWIDVFGDKPILFQLGLSKDTLLPIPFIIKNKIINLGQVVVTAKQTIGTPIESLPSLEIDADVIRKEVGGSLIQTLEKNPGIKSIGIGSSNAKPLIRGLGFNQVAVVENGIKHEGQEWGADHGLEIDQYSVNRLEIIKGPASFLYGSDALGGTINIKTNTAPSKHSLAGSIDLVGKSNNLQAGGSINLYGRNDQWFFDIRSTYMNYADYRVPADTVYIYSYAVNLHKSFVRNTAGSEFNNRINFGYIGNKIRSIFSISNNFNRNGFFANAHGIAPINVNQEIYDASNRDILLPYQQVNHLKFSNQTNIYLKQHFITIEAGYQNNFRTEYSKYVAHGYMPPVFPDWMNIQTDLEREYNKNTITLNASDKVSIRNHNVSFGINTEYQQNKIGGWGFLIPAYKNYNLGGFILDKYRLNDNWTLFGALRYDLGYAHISSYYDWFESEIETNGITQKEKLQKAQGFTKFFNNVSWSAGMVFIKNGWTINANIGKSFRMPIAKELSANGVNYHYFRYENGNINLSPEQSYQLDFGMTWENKKWNFNATPFVNYFSNYIFLNSTSDYDTYYGAGNQIFEYTQTKVFRSGFELTVSYRPIQMIMIESGIEYLYGIQLSGAKRYYPLPFSPPASGSFSLSYEPKLWEKHLTKTYFKTDIKIALAQNKILPPEKETPGYHVWGLSMGTSVKLEKSKIDFRFSIYNLFNQTYLNHTSFYRLIELPEQGRNIVLSVKIPFSFK